MKLLVVSDIHGSLFYTKKMVEIMEKEEVDKVILLGDLYYHGPRNPLPKEYNPQAVIQLLNSIKDKIIAIRGNCDSEVDQMVLEFPIMADYNIIPLNNRKLMASHGHIYHEKQLPNSLVEGDIFIFGHIHIPVLEQKDGVYILNPGSATLPKENHPNSYGILENHHLQPYVE